MDIDKLIRQQLILRQCKRFGSLMDIDKLILVGDCAVFPACFGSLMDIDKLIRLQRTPQPCRRFGSLMDIDKLILNIWYFRRNSVLVL